MKHLSITTGLLALLALVAQLQLGPAYKIFDCCATCGLRRTWFSFQDDTIWGGSRFLVQVKPLGDSQHHHVYWDPQYIQYPVFIYVAFAFALVAIATGVLVRRNAVVTSGDQVN